MATKLNVNIRTLLANCEELAKSEQNFWRLQKFIKSLDTMLAELEAMGDPQSVKRIPGYLERLQALKISTGYADVPGSTTKTPSQSSAVSETGENALKEIRQLQNSKYHNELRKELLQGNKELTNSFVHILKFLKFKNVIVHNLKNIYFRFRCPAKTSRSRWILLQFWKRKRSGNFWWKHEPGCQVLFECPGEDHRAHALADSELKGTDGDRQQDYPARHGGCVAFRRNGGSQYQFARKRGWETGATFEKSLQVLAVADDCLCNCHFYRWVIVFCGSFVQAAKKNPSWKIPIHLLNKYTLSYPTQQHTFKHVYKPSFLNMLITIL